MDYLKIYNSIIQNGKNRTHISEYMEKHHIIPKCLGGNNDIDNIVKLTYREHFIVHWILCKIHNNNHKIKAAFAKMLETNKSTKRITSSHMFSAVKRNLKNTHFEWLQNKIPWNKDKKSGQIPWNKGKKLGEKSEEIKKKTSETLKELYKTKPHHRKGKSPWCAGTKGTGIVVAWNKGKIANKLPCEHCNLMVDHLNMKKWHGDRCKYKT